MMNSVNKIHKLRVICGGVGNSPWYGQHFTPIKNCEILLSIEGFEKALNDPLKSSSWIRIANLLFPLIDKSEKFRITFDKLLKLILDHRAVDGRDEFLSSVWKKSELSKNFFETTYVEEFLKKEPKYIEMKIVDIVEEIVNKENVKTGDINGFWNNDDRYSIIIKWCLESTFIFSLVASILNEFLILFSNHQSFIKILNLIKCFVYNVLEKCRLCGKDFVKLYPWHYRHLIYLLKCKPIDDDDESIMKQIIPIIEDELKTRPEVIIVLLSHYSAWCVE